MKRVWMGAAILTISLLNFFQFPGHTWLQSDTQIYAPILEHMWDPTALGKDLIVQYPHVAFTLYDETAIALRKVTGLDFRRVLEGEQFVLRVLGIWGVYLMATALGLSDLLALLVAAIFSLGAFITGPAVVIFEYEPVPRGFAVPLIFLAIGLVAHNPLFWVRLWRRRPHSSCIRRAHVPFWVVLLLPGDLALRDRGEATETDGPGRTGGSCDHSPDRVAISGRKRRGVLLAARSASGRVAAHACVL